VRPAAPSAHMACKPPGLNTARIDKAVEPHRDTVGRPSRQTQKGRELTAHGPPRRT
jgi:hypothetical protein